MNLNNENLITYRIATEKDLENVWEKDIARHLDDERWVRWKMEYISYNQNLQAVNFVAVKDDGDVIAQVTLITSTEVKAVKDKPLLCDGKSIANFNAFRCDEEFRGQGHISKLVRIAEKWATENGIKTITIGVEANNAKNIMIYFHFGFTEFVMFEIDEDENELVLYYKKNLS